MLVSVIILTHNRPELLPEAVASVKAQTHPDVQLLIIDDASEPWAADYTVHIERSRGAAYAANWGLRMAHGEAICRLDDDDLFTPHYLEVCVAALARGYDVAGLGTLDGSEAANTMDAAGVFRREWAKRAGGFELPDGLDFFMDWYFWLKLKALGATSFDVGPELLALGEKGHKVRKGHPRMSDPYESNIGYYLACRDEMLKVWQEWRKTCGLT